MVITITDEIKNSTAGVYLIMFRDGSFYIGSSKDVYNRVKVHLRGIKSNFKTWATCKPLSLMKDFDGEITISLIEPVDVSNKGRIESMRAILNTESKHILLNKNNKNCLNWNRKAYGKRAIDVKCVNI